jgi:7-carboxy-7-deazaguanine synthase
MEGRSYAVKSIFLTLQGEGVNTGRLAVFCRFAGCNLWNGREVDRAKAICRFCDTEFVGTDGPGGGRFENAEDLADAIEALWPLGRGDPFVVFTGGEPSLQLDSAVAEVLHSRRAEIAVETNGTNPLCEGIDWICVSPKAGAPLAQLKGNELKVAWPQRGLRLEDLERLDFQHFLLQPIDGPGYSANVRAVARACEERERWRPSLQVHKMLGIP